MTGNEIAAVLIQLMPWMYAYYILCFFEMKKIKNEKLFGIHIPADFKKEDVFQIVLKKYTLVYWVQTASIVIIQPLVIIYVPYSHTVFVVTILAGFIPAVISWMYGQHLTVKLLEETCEVSEG